MLHFQDKFKIQFSFSQSLPKARRGCGCLISEDKGLCENEVKYILQKNCGQSLWIPYWRHLFEIL